MNNVLSLIVAALLVISFVEATPADITATKKLFRRGNQLHDQCTNKTWDRGITRKFNAIIFGDFTAGGFRGTVGPLAVQGNFNAPNYNINTLLPVNCSDTSSLDSYGWVLGGNTNSFNTQVYGSVYIGGKNSSLEEITELQPGCIVTESQGTGLFDFETVRHNREQASRDLSNLLPTYMFDIDGKTSKLIEVENPNYDVFTLNSCQTGHCSYYPNLESSADGIFFGKGNWSGLKDVTLNSNKTVVLNIPVTNGTAMNITTFSPSVGFHVCRLIFNFYPVDEEGNFVTGGTFDIIRNTEGHFTGYILAPLGRILDGQTGNFGGNLIAKEYAWTAYAKVDGDQAGSSIYWYEGPSKCDEFEGCIPVHDDIQPPIYIPLPEPTRARIRTQTYAITREIESVRTVSYPRYTTLTVESYPSSIAPSSCQPTTIISTGSKKTVVLPGTTVVVNAGNGRATTVTIKDKTVEVVPDVHVVTKTDIRVTRTTVDQSGRTITHVETNPVYESCTQSQLTGHNWGHHWDDDKYKYDHGDHSNHHHGPDEECYESDDYDYENQYQKEW